MIDEIWSKEGQRKMVAWVLQRDYLLERKLW